MSKTRDYLNAVLTDGCDALKLIKEGERQGIAKSTILMQAGLMGFKIEGIVFKKQAPKAKPTSMSAFPGGHKKPKDADNTVDEFFEEMGIKLPATQKRAETKQEPEAEAPSTKGPIDHGKLNKDGDIQLECGCTHDGTRWLKMCPTHRAETDATHARWTADRERKREQENSK
jgi:hypothetical protein